MTVRPGPAGRRMGGYATRLVHRGGCRIVLVQDAQALHCLRRDGQRRRRERDLQRLAGQHPVGLGGGTAVQQTPGRRRSAPRPWSWTARTSWPARRSGRFPRPAIATSRRRSPWAVIGPHPPCDRRNPVGTRPQIAVPDIPVSDNPDLRSGPVRRRGPVLRDDPDLGGLVLRGDPVLRGPVLRGPVLRGPVLERPGAERPGAERPGAERPGAGRSGAGRSGAGLSGSEGVRC